MPPKLKGGPKISVAITKEDIDAAPLADPTTLFPEGETIFKEKDFHFIHELGSGAGGSVSKVLYKPKNSIMARKVIIGAGVSGMGFSDKIDTPFDPPPHQSVSVQANDENERRRAEKNLKAELKILHICRSEYIVSSFGAYSYDGAVMICMEYMDVGSLDYIMRKTGPIPEPILGRIAVYVLRGLVYLTEKNIVHRDIKPSNILVNSQGQVKITDFGVSKEIVSSVSKTFTGTQAYLGPERIAGSQNYGVVSDIWSLGISLIELATGKFPYPEMDFFALLTYIQEKPSPTLPAGKFPKDFEDFVARSLTKDVKLRAGPERLLQNAYALRIVSEGIDLSEWAMSVKAKSEEGRGPE
ncbi:Dual specificity mitogen-activated protein kinase kinase 1 [Irineochytrium annulatum]|nr:Dual specificity mitogen-activated protein kinase kinase 1 [Irineochytrium annulatum]